jgi:hypothetical protein
MSFEAQLRHDRTVAWAAHDCRVSKSKQKAARRARKVQTARHATAPGPAKAVSFLPEADLLEQIRLARIDRDDAEADLAKFIDSAVSRGVGWPQIATQLGVTRQAARQQYLRRRAQSASDQSHVA